MWKQSNRLWALNRQNSCIISMLLQWSHWATFASPPSARCPTSWTKRGWRCWRPETTWSRSELLTRTVHTFTWRCALCMPWVITSPISDMPQLQWLSARTGVHPKTSDSLSCVLLSQDLLNEARLRLAEIARDPISYSILLQGLVLQVRLQAASTGQCSDNSHTLLLLSVHICAVCPVSRGSSNCWSLKLPFAADSRT